MGFLSSWDMEETVAENSDFAPLGIGSWESRTDSVSRRARLPWKIAVFDDLGTPPADKKHSVQQGPNKAKAPELSVA